MYKILIDSTDRYEKSVKLEKSGEIIDELTGDFDITVAVRDILMKHDLKTSDIAEFEANPGPGSFTGLKIGVTIANILNWVNGNKKIVHPEYGSEPNIHKTKWLE